MPLPWGKAIFSPLRGFSEYFRPAKTGGGKIPAGCMGAAVLLFLKFCGINYGYCGILFAAFPEFRNCLRS